MESKKVQAKEIKNDAILDIKVNKTFYLMSKSALFSTFSRIYKDTTVSSENFVKSIVSKKYEEMNDEERTFYTLSLLVGEIEKQAIETNSFIEKDISEKDLADAVALRASKKSNED
jgi:hypothetical protein|tara:strand:- start:298 stop:645 length:348 start_codon:yes stop_codon:yes gene_type:complete